MVATASARGLRLIAHHDLAGHGDGMQVMREGDAVYVGHNGTSRAGTSILDVSKVSKPELVAQWPAPWHTHTQKVQVAGDLLLVNHEGFPPRGPRGPHEAGLAVHRLDDPFSPELIGFWETGGRGVHRIVWEGGRYAHMSLTPPGFHDRIWVVVDLHDPANPVPVGHWWWPGQAEGEQRTWPEGDRHAAHHALVAGDRAYLAYDDANMVILDISDITRPRMISHAVWDGGTTHTCLPLPGRGLVAVTDEQRRDGPGAPERRMHVIDVSDDTNPGYVSTFPVPDGDFDQRPLRFGPHNLHENRRGSYRSERLLFATYFNAGVRVYHLDDPAHPVEVAHWVSEPPRGSAAPQANDLFVDTDGLIWVTDRCTGGLFLLEPAPGLAALMRDCEL